MIEVILYLYANYLALYKGNQLGTCYYFAPMFENNELHFVLNLHYPSIRGKLSPVQKM